MNGGDATQLYILRLCDDGSSVGVVIVILFHAYNNNNLARPECTDATKIDWAW